MSKRKTPPSKRLDPGNSSVVCKHLLEGKAQDRVLLHKNDWLCMACFKEFDTSPKTFDVGNKCAHVCPCCVDKILGKLCGTSYKPVSDMDGKTVLLVIGSAVN